MKLYPYNQGSKSAKALANALGIKRLKHEGPIARVDTLINWGSSQFQRIISCANILNKPESIAKAVNKLQAFNALKGHASIPEYTESAVEALKWLDEGVTVVVRQKLTGHSGEGVVICEPGSPLFKENMNAPLFVKYINKKEEYRLHVFRDKVFFIQRKARNKDVPDDQVNWKVRNHGNGFIFAHQGVDVPEEAKKEAITAIQALGLDFGAVDLIWNQKNNKYYVLEVNTACGMEGTTLDKYVEVFKEFV